MENELFSWEDYKLLENLRVVFSCCTLKQTLVLQGLEVGWHSGAKIKEIEIDYLGGVITFFDIQDGQRIVLDTFYAALTLMRKI